MRVLATLHRLVPVALCALGAHAALYRSFWPEGGGHAYFTWYEPLVGGLSLGAVLVLLALALVALTGRHRIRPALVRFVAPAARSGDAFALRTVRLAFASLAFLVVQESCERMVASHTPAVAGFGPGEILTVIAVLAALAAFVALVERSCVLLVALVLGRRRPPRHRAAPLPLPPSRRPVLRRRNALAELRGLRAPPLTV